MALEFQGSGQMRLVERDDGSATIYFDDKGIGRSCGTCGLCCKLLPIKSVNKPAGQKCLHHRFGKGCMIYATRPNDCRTWACRWLCDERTRDLKRPDRAHYVIDLEPDKVLAQDRNTGAEHAVSVLQIWIDPAFPDAHKDPDLRAYLVKINVPAVVRLNSRDGFLLSPPAWSGEGDKWLELPMVLSPERDHRGLPINPG